MNFTFENQGTHTYLVYTIAQDDTVDSMSLGMLTNNKIHGLAHTLFTQMDNTKFIKYDVSAKISAKQFFTGAVNKKRLLGVFKGIVDAMMSAEDYMIDINTVVLDLGYIFADVSTCETVLVCLPIISDELQNTDLGVFFKNIMFSTQFDQTENCDYIAKIINFLNGTPTFSLQDFGELLTSVENTVSKKEVATPIAAQQTAVPKAQPVVEQSKPAQPQQPVVQNVQKPNIPSKPTPVQVAVPQKNDTMQHTQPEIAGEKSMSWFYLMQHYNKENAEIYKAQKANKNKNAVPPKPTVPPPSYTQKQVQPAFAVPGQPTPPPPVQPKKQTQPAFAIPGQPTPPPAAPKTTANQNFAVPGQQPNVQQAKPVQATQTTNPYPVQSAVVSQPTYNQPRMPQGQSMNFGETTVLGTSAVGETTVLGVTSVTQTKPHIVRIKNNEKINLDKPVFRIGKEKSYVDYFVGDNSAISRSHANIISRDGEYFVVDTNSTNHTYVDGQMIQSNVETKISHGTKIRLANEEFEFKLF